MNNEDVPCVPATGITDAESDPWVAAGCTEEVESSAKVHTRTGKETSDDELVESGITVPVSGADVIDHVVRTSNELVDGPSLMDAVSLGSLCGYQPAEDVANTPPSVWTREDSQVSELGAKVL